MKGWYPSGTRHHYGPPPVGSLLAHKHAVWVVDDVVDIDLDDDARQEWIDAGMPDVVTWQGRPFEIWVTHQGGWIPSDWPATPEEDGKHKAAITSPASTFGHSWDIYHGGRWPMCSCCGEPMPCRSELEDREINKSLDVVAKHEAKMPGCCWSCGEVITKRQAFVDYPGDNLDLPGGNPVLFHTRSDCRYDACKYELRWISADPRRERVLTYPNCRGVLIVHADGTTECSTGTTPLGTEAESQSGCRGHLTHDHGTVSSCYIQGDWFGSLDGATCPRGCRKEDHHGCGAISEKRPKRRASVLEQTLAIGGKI